jgi:hypothetical protein
MAWVEGNTDYLFQAAAGGAQFAYHQAVTHPWETAGFVALGVAAVALAPAAGLIGASAAVVTGIDVAVTAGGAALAVYGTAHGISDLNRATHTRAAHDAHAILTHPDGHSQAEVEAARRVVRNSLGRGTFETSMGALGLAGTALSGVRLAGSVGKFTARVPKAPVPEEVPPPPPPPPAPPPTGSPPPHTEVLHGTPPPPPHAEVANGTTPPPHAEVANGTPPPPHTEVQNGNPAAHGASNGDANEPVRTEHQMGRETWVETVYPQPRAMKTPVGIIRYTRSEEAPNHLTFSNPEGLGLPGNPVHLRFNVNSQTITQIFNDPGEVSTPYGAMTPNSVESVSDLNTLSHIENEYHFWDNAGSAQKSDPLSALNLLRVEHTGRVQEIYSKPVAIDGFSDVISREISPDKQTMIHVLDDLSEHTSVRQPDGSYVRTSSTEALREPGASDFNFSIGAGSLVDHFEPAQDMGTPYGVMPLTSRETITDSGAEGTGYNFAPSPAASHDPIDSMGSLQVNANGSVEENYVHPVKIDGVANVVTRIISADKKSIRYIAQDGSVVTAVRRPDGSIVRRPPTHDPES